MTLTPCVDKQIQFNKWYLTRRNNHQYHHLLDNHNYFGNKMSTISLMLFKKQIQIKISWVMGSGDTSFPSFKSIISIKMKSYNSFKSYQNSSKLITVYNKLIIKLNFVVNLELSFINFRILSISNTNNRLNTLNLWLVNNIMKNNSINFCFLN